jgi:microcystin-dependent protein
MASNLDPNAVTGGLGYTPINKAGDRLIGGITINTTGTTNATINITAIPSTTGMLAGMAINGAGIPAGATIASIVSGTAITLSVAATTSGTGVTLTVTSVTGGGQLQFINDTAVNGTAVSNAAIQVSTTTTNEGNTGYMPAIGFNRPNAYARTLGLSTTGRFETVDHAGTVGYLLDTVTGVDTASYQAGSITLAALAQSLVNIVIPPGMVRMFAGPYVPSDWLVCDGRAVSRTSYAALYAAVGTYWGAGDNISTFNLPDFRGRSPLGYVSSAVGGITARSFASNGGEENHVLNGSELASHYHGTINDWHSHGIQQSPHSHTYVNPFGSLVGIPPGSSGYTGSGGTQTSGDNANITVLGSASNITIANAGGNQPHNNMQPFAVLYFIIKT